MLRTGGQKVVITDFGLAKPMDDASMTRIGLIAKTPLYISLEQCRGKSFTERSDLFSLRGVIYFLATGMTPFADIVEVGILSQAFAVRDCYPCNGGRLLCSEHLNVTLAKAVLRRSAIGHEGEHPPRRCIATLCGAWSNALSATCQKENPAFSATTENAGFNKRRRWESNPRWRICNPLP